MSWRCFFCDEVFETRETAAEHFGSDDSCEMDIPACLEATKGLQPLVTTNRELWSRLLRVESTLEQAEFERDCWAQAGRKAVGDPYATWHDIGHIRLDAEDKILAATAAFDAAPQWLKQFLRRRAEKLWNRKNKK